MFDIANKLLIAKELKLEAGRIDIFGVRSQAVPTRMFVELLHNSEDPTKTGYDIYDSTRISIAQWIDGMAKNKGLHGESQFKWMKKIWALSGWGKLSFNATKVFKGRFSCNVNDSPFAKVYLDLYGKSKYPVCHLIRGGLAGGAVSLTKIEDVHCIEKKCMAQGHPRCEFIIRPNAEFEGVDQDFMKKQIQPSQK